jgi:tRNA A-37 threonylcarbamoyl transferase component Bud32
VFTIDDTWVLRRTRDGRDVANETRVMAHLRDHGYPVPQVRVPGGPGTDPATDVVMERLQGPTMLESLLAGATTPEEAGTVLARSLRRLHEIPALVAAHPSHRVLHLDLHPDNVVLTPGGPVVIDWSDTEEGTPDLDWAMSALILAQVAVGDPAVADSVRVMLAALLAGRGPGVRLGPVRSSSAGEGAAPGAVESKAEEGADAERRRLTTTPEAAAPGPATPRGNSGQDLKPPSGSCRARCPDGSDRSCGTESSSQKGPPGARCPARTPAALPKRPGSSATRTFRRLAIARTGHRPLIGHPLCEEPFR